MWDKYQSFRLPVNSYRRMSITHVELLPMGNLVSLLQLHTGDDL